MTAIPPSSDTPYNHSIWGCAGEMGSGSGVTAVFLQTVLRPADLERAQLISDIPGSERWAVRDLFQRDVDVARVTNSVLPYLKDPTKTKFFNPLTLTLLPLDTETGDVVAGLPALTPRADVEDDVTWACFEHEGFFELQSAPQTELSKLSWNDSTTRLVAIDGQHRLSALLKLKNDPKNMGEIKFQDWAIPVVIVVFRSEIDATESISLLDVVRSIFVYINTTARPPSEARAILLTDESINDVAVQELVQRSHSNDLVRLGARVETILPLLFFDWRGDEIDGRATPTPAALKSLVELKSWFETYLLGEDFGRDQQIALGLIDRAGPLQSMYVTRQLPLALTDQVRAVVNESVIPGLALVLENFSPYAKYVSGLRALEAKLEADSDVARHAFHQLRFGSHQGPDELTAEISRLCVDVVDHIMDLKAEIPVPLDLDIGMRGVISAFGELKAVYDAACDRTSRWRDYADWFVSGLNAAYDAGWVTPAEGTPQRKLLRHITEDHNETVVNYRLEDAEDAYGAFLTFVVIHFAALQGGPDLTAGESTDDLRDRLTSTWMRGFKKEFRPALREDYPNGGSELTQAVRKKAERRAVRQAAKLEKDLLKLRR